MAEKEKEVRCFIVEDAMRGLLESADEAMKEGKGNPVGEYFRFSAVLQIIEHEDRLGLALVTQAIDGVRPATEEEADEDNS